MNRDKARRGHKQKQPGEDRSRRISARLSLWLVGSSASAKPEGKSSTCRVRCRPSLSIGGGVEAVAHA